MKSGVRFAAVALLFLAGILGVGEAAHAQTVIWSATLTAEANDDGSHEGYDRAEGYGSLSGRTFTYKGNSFSINLIESSNGFTRVEFAGSEGHVERDLFGRSTNPNPVTLNIGSGSWMSSSSGVNFGGTLILIFSEVIESGNTYAVSIATTEPGAPQSLTATSTGSEKVKLNWSAPSSIGGTAISGYKYRYKKSGANAFGDWTAISNSASLTEHAVGGLEENTGYTFQMLATNDAGDGLYSDEVPVTTLRGAPTVTLVLDPDRISENNGRSTVTATLDHPSTAATTVTVSASAVDPAMASHFTLSTNKVLTIAANATTSTGAVTIAAVNNDDDDPNRQVTVSGTAVNTAGVTQPSSQTLTIADDESASTKVTLSVSPTRVHEDATGAAQTVTVSAELDGDARTEGTQVAVSVSGGSAVAGTHYAAVPEFTFTIAAGQTTGAGTFTLAPIDDNLDEPDVTVTVTGTTTSGLSIEPESGLFVKILDDDDPPTVTLVLDPDSIDEDGGESTVTATLDKPSLEDIDVTVSASPVAPAEASDFTLSDETVLAIEAGDTTSSGTVTITANNNDVGAGDQRVTVSGEAVSDGDGDLTPPEDVTLTITEDDEVATTVTLTVDPSTVAEDAAGSDRTVMVTAELDGAREVATPVAVSVTGGTAVAGTDYAAVDDFTVTIAARMTSGSATFTLGPVDDQVDERAETVVLTGTTTATDLTVAPAEGVTVTITDNDPRPQATLVLTPPTIDEDGGESTVTATLDRPSSAVTTITVTHARITGTTSSDYRVSDNKVLTIAAGRRASTGTVTFTGKDNNVYQPNARHVVVEGSASNLQGVGGPNNKLLTIREDEVASTKLTLSASPVSVSEGGGDQTVTLTATVDEAARPSGTPVRVSVSGGTAVAGTDYSAVEDFTFRILPGRTSGTGTFTLTPVDDEVDEPDVTVTVTATTPSGVGLPVEPLSGLTITIADDDQAAGQLVLNLNAIAGDDTVNIAEKTAGFSISGDTGTEAGVTVSVAVGSTTLTATSADVSGTAKWSVTVPAEATYITGASVGVTVSASKTGFTPPSDVERTLTIDLTAPTAPTYTAPDSLKLGSAIAAMSPTGGSGIDVYGAVGLPSGLSINASTGAISGTPDTVDANTAEATVTVSDTAGNSAEVSIAFPAVDKGDQTLSGFAYSAETVTFGDTAPALTAPPDAVGTLSYTATPNTVCTVNGTTGALTIVGAGACEVTVTAASTKDYKEATATVTVTVNAAGTLSLNLDTIATDDTVNIAEKTAGFSISGDTGAEAGVTVSVAVGSTTLTGASADVSGTAKWSVTVPADATYITGASVGVTVSASKTGFTPPSDVERTLTIDLTAPTAPTYTAPDSLKLGSAIAAMSPTGGSGIDVYGVVGLPSGLSINAGTGAISGTPDTVDANTAEATVTVSDTAGNSAEVSIAFPAVDKGDQTLSGFAYSAETVTFGDTAPALTAPPDAVGTLSYTATPNTVCTVNGTTGALTIVGAGACEVTVTAASTKDYNEATATVTVTVNAAGTLSLNLDTIATDDTVNIAEKTAGFSISGDTGTEAGVTVSVAVGSTTLTGASADVSGTAKWSVTVPAEATYITGASVGVTVSASKTGFTPPSDVERTLTIDLTAPTAPSYTAPDSLKLGSAIVAMSPTGGSGIDVYGVVGLPSGLSINASTGAISGTPDTVDANTAEATVTVSDTAGNSAEVSIAFPAVDKGDQTLSGFAYSAETVTFGDTAPALTAPPDAVGTLSYTATPNTVCTVNGTTGALTIVGAGACEVTVTAASTKDYKEATATVTVTVNAAGTLSLNLDTIATDDTVNIAEKTAGFSISGDTGAEAGVTVSVAVGSTTLTGASADVSGTAKWSVTVPAEATYITGASVGVTVSASKTGFTPPSDVERTLTIDLTAPTAPTYTAPDSLKLGSAIVAMSPTGGSGIDVYGVVGLPSGLSINASTGAISGTPDTIDANTAEATVTVSDNAGNRVALTIAFPAVEKRDQTLTGFEYSSNSIAFGDTAPTVTALPSAVGTLSYTATPAEVCTVNETSGALTIVGVGDCEVTVTAASTDEYNEAAAKYTVTVNAAGITVTGTTVTVIDDDERGVSIRPASLLISEGGSSTYSVVLTSEPTDTVTVAIGGDSGTDLTLDNTSLDFTASNWNQAQIVTVSAGQDDDAEDDTATLSHSVSGGDYGSVTAGAVSVTVIDEEKAATQVTLTVNPATVNENDTATTVTVTGTLDGAPRTSDTAVTVSVGASGDSAVAGTDYASVDDLTLTVDAGQTSRTVIFTLTPTDDGLVEGDETLTVSGATNVDGLTVAGSSVTIGDDDTRGVLVSPTSLTVAEGDSGTYTVVLTSRPTGAVRVTISGTTGTDLRRSRSFLSFRTSNWNEPQTVTVTARQDDDTDDDTITISHAVFGADYGANGVTADAVTVSIDDDDVVSTGVELSLNPGSIEEGAGFSGLVLTGRLNGVPRDEPTNVTVSVGASDDAAVAGTDYMAVDDLSLTIPSGQARATAIFVFRPMEDRIDERVEAVSITGTTDVEGFEVSGTTLSIADNDERGVQIMPTALTVAEGGNETYSVVLTSEPTGEVMVTPSVKDNADVTFIPAALTFTASDWDEPQTVTVTAAQDADAANDTVTIEHAVTGADYGANSTTADDVTVTVADDETVVTLTLDPAAVDEGAEATTVTVTAMLDGETRNEPTPVAVTVGAADDAAVAGTDYVPVADLSLTIPSGESSGTATFTLTPVENFVDEPDKAVSINGATEVEGLVVTGTTLIIADNDERGVTVTPTVLTFSEGGSETYTVVLNTRPTDTVTVTPAVNGSSDVTVSAALTFTTADWDQAQTVTVTAAQDADAENETATISHAISGAGHDAGSPMTDAVSVTIEDDETAVTLTLDPAAVDEGAEATTVTVTAMLDGETRTEPTAIAVTVGSAEDAASAGTDYVAVDDLSLTIPSGESSGTATFTFTPMEDLIDEPVETLSITGATEVEGIEVTGTTLSIADNDERGVTVLPTTITLSEGENSSYTVVLDTEPTDTVTVAPSVSGSPDMTFEPASLTFTPSDWDTAQTMSVTATEDDDAYHDSSIVSHAAEGGDYASLVEGEISVTISDNELESQGTLPAQVTDVSTTATATHVDLSWSAVEGTVLGYRIEASYDGGANWAEVQANTGSAGTATTTESADSTDSTETTQPLPTSYRHDVGLNFAETRLYRVSAVGENGAGLPSVTVRASATTMTAGLTAIARTLEELLDSTTESKTDPMSVESGDSMSEDTMGAMSRIAADPAPAIDVCWIPQGVAATELSEVAIAWTPVQPFGSGDSSALPWQSIGVGSVAVACEDGIGFRVTSISGNQRYAFRMRARVDGVWLVSNDAEAVLADSSKPLRTVLAAGTSGLSGDTPAPELLCRNYNDPAIRENEEGAFLVTIGFTTASSDYLRYEPVNGFDPSSDLTLVNATAELLDRPYDTQLGYRVRITPTLWGEPVAVSVAADVVTHAETAVGNQASGEFRTETSDAEHCDAFTGEPVLRAQVTATTIETDGDRNGEWTTGEPIRVTLQFNERVSVATTDGVPGVTLAFGEAATAVTAPFSHVAHQDTLVFEHLVTADESPIGTVTLLADSLTLNGGQIDSFSGPAVDLAHAGASVADGQIEQPDLTAGWSLIPDAHDGTESYFEIHLQFSEAVDPVGVIGERNLRDHAFTVTNGAIESLGPARDQHGEYLANEWRLRVVPDSDEPVTIAPVVDRACDEPGAICTVDDRPLTAAQAVTIHRTVQALSVADAEVGEGPGAVLVFEVTLTRAAEEPIAVDYETVDGTAAAEEDYEAVSGTLSIEAGQTSATVHIPVLDDSHDEGEETLTLILSNASNAQILDGEALGVIVNSDPIPGAWLSRFGRAASDHVAQAVARRLERRSSEEHLTVGGLRLDRLFTSSADREADAAASASTLTGPDTVGGPQAAGPWTLNGAANGYAGIAGGLGTGAVSSMPMGGNGAQGFAGGIADPSGGSSSGSRTLPSLRDALLGSSFFYTYGDSEDPTSGPLTAWGETATTRFRGSEGGLSLDGEVSTATLGLDKQYGRWLVGTTLSFSEGDGGYGRSDAPGGSVQSTLTSLNPYAHFTLNETMSLWGVIGYGGGRLRLTPEGTDSVLETDLSNRMAAFGGRGLLNTRVAGLELAWVSDALLTDTDSEAVRGLTGAQGSSSRVRLLLEGSGNVPLWGGTLRPTVEAGLRYDGGDAETGAGIEIGGGLGYAAGPFAVRVNARGLVAHEDTSYEEWGFSGSIQYQPGKDGRGLSMKLGSAWGATQSGVQSLWSQADASGLARNSAFDAAQRFQAELGYGIAGRKPDRLWNPYLAAQATDGAGQALTVGLKFTSGPHVQAGLEFGRRDSAHSSRSEDSEHAIQLTGSIRW